MEKIIFINFWNKGGMKHYSDAFVRDIAKSYSVYYIRNYATNVNSKGLILYLRNNILDFKNYLSLLILSVNVVKYKPKAIHINSGFPLLLVLYPFFRFYNTVITIHDAKPHEGESFFKITYHYVHLIFIFLFIKKVIVHSKLIERELPWLFRIKNIYVVPHVNFDNEENLSGSIEHSNLRVLFFGRILKYKGLNYLLEAFKELPKEEYALTIAGEGHIEEGNTKESNIFLINRFIEDIEIPVIFNKIDVLVLPYISASQSGVIRLAQKFNKPIIATKVGAIPELINDGVTGILISPKSVIEIITALKYLRDKKHYLKMIENIKKANLHVDILSYVKSIYI